ncbi:MAG TPA: hypothetical protein VF618_19545 [Thermoanaerobaculia bacterium]
MNGNDDLVAKIKGTSTLERATFGPGMLLRHDDLEQLNVYPRELSRLLFRSLFGCGVVCGLVVSRPRDECDKFWVTVSSGLALDCSGNPIHVPKDTDPISFVPKSVDQQLWVVLCGKTTGCSPRISACASDDEESSPVPSREKDGYEISIVRKLPKCICVCDAQTTTESATQGNPAGPKEAECKCPCVGPENPCYAGHYNGDCGCDGGKDCCCDCVVLAQLNKESDREWTVTHHVRRFVRPVLMRDPVVAGERAKAATKKAEQTAKEAEERQEIEKAVAVKVAAMKAEADKAAADKAAAERDAQRLQQLANQRETPVLREKARSSKSRSSK